MHADHQGSTLARTDIYGTVTKGYLYNSFGVPANQGFDPYHYTYTGREWDNIFKVFYYRARYYDPEAGRFLSADPIGFAGGDANLFTYVDTVGKPTLETNLYAYTGNNPINRIDPSGLTWLEFDSYSNTLTVHPGDFVTYGPGVTFPAANNAQRNSRGKWNPGLYWFDYWVPHAGGSPNSRYGSNGNFVFHMPNCVGCGVHSGRQDSCDQASRCGVEYATLGCIRASDNATSMMRRLHQSGDPVILLIVK